MKYKLPVLFLWLLVFNFACHYPVQDEIILVSRHLIADTVCSYPHLFKGSVILKNSHIFMIDPFNAGDMYIFNTRSGQMDNIRTEYPDYFSMNDATEFADALLQHLPLSFYHSYMSSYYQYTLENNQVKLARQNLKLKGVHINRAEQLGENKYVTLGFFRTGLLGLYDKESKEMKYYGHYPIPVDIPFERTAMERIVQSFQGNIAYSDKHSKVVYGSFDFAYLSCYYFTGKKLKFQWEKHIVPPPATQIVDGALETDKTVARGGFSDVTIAGDYIFASYNQKNVKDSLLPDVTHSILVYDMTGNQIATFLVDASISGIMIDVKGGSFYGISREDEPVIVRFQFDKI